jgi:DNA modification methylase
VKKQRGKANPINQENIPGYYYKKERGMTDEEIIEQYVSGLTTSGTSIFDPVLCEIVYRWFCPTGGKVLDPFAGGSVRGIVAEYLGRNYTGIDLSGRQLEANRVQADSIGVLPVWIEGDSRNVATLAPGEYDLVFSCPPYADLEIYSDDERDISTMEYGDFLEAYREIISESISMLKDNRFACFVVGDVRDKNGFYRCFVSDTIQAFIDAGMMLYNEAILVTAVGSLPIRIGKQFQGYRKLGKTHQNVLVFYKGDPKMIRLFGDVECGEIE